MIFDLHVHTSFSPCSRMGVAGAIHRAWARGLDGICITDHDTMDIRHTLSEGVQENGLCVILGMEYSTARGDFLIFGPFEDLEPNLPADRLLQTVDRLEGIAVAAHPFRRQRPVDERLIDQGLCRAIESINGRNTPAENLAVKNWKQRHDLAECGGSDAHTIDEVGTVATQFFTPIRTRSDLIRAVKQGLCRPYNHAAEQIRPFVPGRVDANRGVSMHNLLFAHEFSIRQPG